MAGADSDLETSEVEEEQDFPTIGSGSESSTYGLTKKKKRRPKEKKEKNPRKKRNDEDEDDDDDDDDDGDGTMKVSLGLAQDGFSEAKFYSPIIFIPAATVHFYFYVPGRFGKPAINVKNNEAINVHCMIYTSH